VFGTAIIVFRETLEAALVVSIVLAACKGVVGRGAWVSGGIAAGALGAVLVAASAQTIADLASGMGQELFNAIVLLVAVVMLGWHNVWMQRHGRELAQEANAIGRAVATGARPLYAVAVVVGLAVLREGSETVLFLYSVAASEGGGAAAMLLGGGVGLLLGAGTGAALYFGLLRIPTRHLFAVTSAMILLLAAGMASQAAAFLVQADILPPLGSEVWDTSWLLRDDGLAGRVFHALAGYVAQPAGIQVLFYFGALALIGGAMRLVRRPSPAGRLARAA
jgi:high-affinity iron transporter